MRWPGFIKGGIFDPFPHDVGKLWKNIVWELWGLLYFPNNIGDRPNKNIVYLQNFNLGIVVDKLYFCCYLGVPSLFLDTTEVEMKL